MIPTNLVKIIFSGEEKKVEKIILDAHNAFIVQFDDCSVREYTLEALNTMYNTNNGSDDELVICEDCNIVYLRNENDVPEFGTNVCEDCFNDNYFECADCNSIENMYDAISVNHGDYYICEDCYSNGYETCYDCNTVIPMDEAIATGDGHIICEDCRIGDYYTCEECNEIYHRDNMNYYEDGGTSCDCCDSCYESLNEQTGKIYDYHEFSDWNMLGHSSNLRYGFELEVEQSGSSTSLKEAASNIYELMNNEIICSHDGSLDYGFEIVSHPMTFAYMQSRKDAIKDMLNYLSSQGYRSHDPNTCGLHVHVTRAALGANEEEIDRTINNILMIFENFMEELIIFSRRAESQINRWAQFISKYTGFEGNVLAMKYIKDNKSTGCRYMAVNLEPRHTIEFRLFRGTLNYNTFMATMQLVHNIVEYAKNNKTINGLTWKKLLGNDKNLRIYNDIRGIKSKTVANEVIIKFGNVTDNKNNISMRPTDDFISALESASEETFNEVSGTSDFIDFSTLYRNMWEAYTTGAHIHGECVDCSEDNEHIIQDTNSIGEITNILTEASDMLINVENNLDNRNEEV